MKGKEAAGMWIRIIGMALVILLWQTGAGWGVVTLIPRMDASGNIVDETVASEDHVYFGEFRHRLMSFNGTKETTATPMLWRVMSSDQKNAPAKAVLLSHYVLDAMAYQPAARPPENQNTWMGSNLQVWLNSTTGFLADFSAREREPSVMLQMDEAQASRVTAPAFWSANYPPLAATGSRIYEGELKHWFGENDFQSNSLPGTGNTARKASFKGQNPKYAWAYWSRSPVDAQSAWNVFTDGTVNLNRVDSNYIGIRPVFMLNLDALLFKTTRDDAARVSNARTAGLPQNPYILVLPHDTRHGLPPFVSADYAPSASINGSTMTLTWPGPVSPAVRKWPHVGDFTLKRAGRTDMHPVSIMPDGTCEDRLVLVFDSDVEAGEAPGLDYNLNFDALSFDVLGGTAKVMAGFRDRYVENKTPAAAVYPTGISFLRCPVTLQVGETVQLEWELTPPDTTERDVVFVLERSVASVDPDGRLTGVSAGKITVRVLTVNGLSAVCVATVENEEDGGSGAVYPTNIRFLRDPVHLKVGETAQLEWIISPPDATETAVTFSFDPSVVTVDENGVARGVAAGVTTVGIETVNGLTAGCAVRVEEEDPEPEPEPSDPFDFVRLEPETPPYYVDEFVIVRAAFSRPARDAELTATLPNGSTSLEKLSFSLDRKSALVPFVPAMEGTYILKVTAWGEEATSTITNGTAYTRELRFEAAERPTPHPQASSGGGCQGPGSTVGLTLLPIAALLFRLAKKKMNF